VFLVGHLAEGLVAVDDGLGGSIDEGHPFCAAFEEVSVAFFAFAEGGVGVVEFGELGGDVVTGLEGFPDDVEVIGVGFDSWEGELVERFEEDFFLEGDGGDEDFPSFGGAGADEADDESAEGLGGDLEFAGVIEEERIGEDGLLDMEGERLDFVWEEVFGPATAEEVYGGMWGLFEGEAVFGVEVFEGDLGGLLPEVCFGGGVGEG
jgi:hypothetical protein